LAGIRPSFLSRLQTVFEKSLDLAVYFSESEDAFWLRVYLLALPSPVL
jgi:hypothetical protein